MLSDNEALPWSLALIEQFKDQWDWERLSDNLADKWRWNGLCDIALTCLPKLSIRDIDEVMNHHFLSDSLSKQAKQPIEPIKPIWNDLDDDLPF